MKEQIDSCVIEKQQCSGDVTSVAGERLDDKEVEDIIKDCSEPEDEDGFVPYVRKFPAYTIVYLMFH